jgi:ATP-binding cassette, subfamily B, bacterial MsbA
LAWCEFQLPQWKANNVVDDQEYNTGKEIYQRLLRHAVKYWKVFIVSVIAMAAVAATSTSFAALMKPLMDGSFVQRDPATIRMVPIALIGIYLVRAIALFVSMYGMSWVGRTIIYELRGEMFHRLVSLPKNFYDKSTTGEVISKFAYNVEQVANASTSAITVLVRDTLTTIGLICWMFYLNATLTLTFVIIGPFIAALVVFVSKRFRKLSTRIQGSVGTVSRVIEESIKAHLVVKIFGGRDYEIQQFDAVNSQNRRQNLRMSVTSALSTSIIQLIIAVALASIIFIATHTDVLNALTVAGNGTPGAISVGTFTSFMIAMFMLFPPIRQLTSVNVELQKGIAAADSIFQLIDMEPEKDTGSYTNTRAQGVIRFDHVSFRYKDTDRNALEDIDLDIEAGQTIAFVGRSGSGKSTLLNLLPRFYDVRQGRILLDGHDVHDYTLDNLRRHISYVGQDVVLFNDTVLHNIAYGALGDVSREQVEHAARSAHALEFIENMQGGLDAVVGERGVMLSGGQRQRIAIARALLKDAPVLILDEATSALDTESEKYIQASLETLMKNRTTLVIAHRLSTIENADRIIVMDQGRIVESGSHTELLSLDKQYAALYRLQFHDGQLVTDV